MPENLKPAQIYKFVMIKSKCNVNSMLETPGNMVKSCLNMNAIYMKLAMPEISLVVSD